MAHKQLDLDQIERENQKRRERKQRAMQGPWEAVNNAGWEVRAAQPSEIADGWPARRQHVGQFGESAFVGSFLRVLPGQGPDPLSRDNALFAAEARNDPVEDLVDGLVAELRYLYTLIDPPGMERIWAEPEAARTRGETGAHELAGQPATHVRRRRRSFR
jgi:hypothetical protein